MSGALASIFSGGVDKIISSVGTVFDNLFTSKEEKAQGELAKLTVLLQAEQIKAQTAVELEKAYIEDQKSLREQTVQEIQSQDWFVRRARPAVMWTGTLMVIWDYMLNPMVQTVYHLAKQTPVVIVPIEIPTEFWLIWATLMGGISILRTIDKKNLLGTPEASPGK